MAEDTKNKPTLVGESLGEIHCPKCGSRINGAIAGKRETCPADDCGQDFSIRLF